MKPLFKPLLVLPVVLLCAGCVSTNQDEESAHPIGREVTRRTGEAPVYAVKEDDAQMEHATAHARRTVGKFITALQHPAVSQRDFQVKKLFVKDGVGEHIWLADVKFIGNRFVGVVDNKPTAIKGLKVGTRVSVNPDEISDWSYVDDGRLEGGYTIRVLYSELSAEERAEFERQADFHIER